MTEGARWASRKQAPWWMRILLILVSAEISLQLIGVGYRWWAACAQASPLTQGEWTILCLGDSFTFGIGAPPQESFPSQLERLLSTRWPTRRIRVVNAGVPSYNSSQVLHHLSQQFDRMHPDLLLVLVGRNDGVSFREARVEVLEAIGASRSARLFIWFDQWLSHIRLYRLAKLLRMAPRQPAVQPIRRDAHPPATKEGRAQLSPTYLVQELREVLTAHPEMALEIVANAVELSGAGPHHVVPTQDTESQRWALAILEGKLERAPDQPRVWKQLGRLFLRAGRKDLAVPAYQKALALDPSSKEALMALAECSRSMRKTEQAVLLYEQLIRRDPHNPQHYLRLATAYEEGAYVDGHRLDRAIEFVCKALALDPTLAKGYALLGDLFRCQKRWDEARWALLRAVQLDPLEGGYWVQLAEVAGVLKDRELSREAWREVFRRWHDLSAFAQLGRRYSDPLEGQQAMRALLEEVKAASVQTEPTYWEPYERLVQHGVSGSIVQQLYEANLEQMVRLSHARGIPMGLLTYPSASDVGWMNEVVRTVAIHHPEVLLLDVEQELADQFKDPRQPLLSSDGVHPNADGYGLLASSVTEHLVVSGALHASGGNQQRAVTHGGHSAD